MTSALRVGKRLLFVLLATATLIGAGCHGHGGGATKPDGGHDAESCSNDAGAHQENGATCRCAADCASGFCADGVCCNTACTEGCKSCDTLAAPGVCSFVAAGEPPRSAAVCPASAATSCGLDGTCDGKGGCRNYPADTVCQPGVCSGAAVVGTRVCDGSGNCTPGAATVCLPFGCDPKSNSCISTCATDLDCGPNVKCVSGSCGLKPIGASCAASSECASTFCADGVCCNVSCSSACVSCVPAGHLGTCAPTARGALDPHQICVATDKSTCGQTGTCDGVGGCAKYAAETVCISPTCSGNRVNTAGTCDGLGVCRAPGVQDCGTYQCAGGACINHCTNNSDCVTGHSCVNGSCGPKSNGQPCSAAGECASNFCADGVCCNSACSGACQSCALSTSLGTCASSPANTADPHGICKDQLATSCGTDGTCDGSGGCHKYPSGTTCADETCSLGIYTPASTCNSSGKCIAPDQIGCAPYLCNGSRCYQACTDNTSCATNNVCTSGSCGPKPNGAFCSAGNECQSKTCAQGVCCATACSGACRSCAITGSMGLCTSVVSGSDPAGVCVDSGAKTCGTDSKCLAGTCEKYPQGTSCASATCPTTGTTYTPASTCDGAGTCGAAVSSSCFPYACGGTACKAACATDADCATPTVCMNGSCGLKPNGAVCSSGTECLSAVCAQGVCCATACTGTCMSCAVSGMAGTCAPVAAGGADPAGHCTNQGAASCGTTGLCNGSGACALYIAGTQCVGASCPSGTATENLPRSCDGSGTCKPLVTQSCAPFACNAATGMTCVAVCSTNADCAPGNVCNAGACGLKRAGQACAAGSECASGNCVDGVCCSSASCGNCQVCNLTGNAGTCQPVAAGSAEPHGGCTASGACGNNGTCDGNGLCANVPVGTSCGTASCTGGSATPVGTCDGAGSCGPTSPKPCAPYVCGTGTACLTMCATNSDCIAGDTCQAGSCVSLLPAGTACTAGAQCLSGFCTDGVCCNSAGCGSCRSCALASSLGTCANVGLVADPAGVCVDQGATTCGTTGLCDGAGQCAIYASGISCAAATCQTGTPTLNGAASCDGAGHCQPVSTTDCTPFACAGAACKTTCTQPSDCATGYTCAAGADGGAATCVASP